MKVNEQYEQYGFDLADLNLDSRQSCYLVIKVTLDNIRNACDVFGQVILTWVTNMSDMSVYCL